MGISYDVDVDVVVGGGAGYTLSLAWVKDDGLLTNFAPKIGSGLDVSASIILEVGLHNDETRGEPPTGENISGISSYESASLGFINLSSSQDISTNDRNKNPDQTPEIGQNWNLFSTGITISTSDVIGSAGNAEIEFTSKPFYLFRNKKASSKAKKRINELKN